MGVWKSKWCVLLPFWLFSRLAQVFGEVTEQRGFSQVKLGFYCLMWKPPRSMLIYRCLWFIDFHWHIDVFAHLNIIYIYFFRVTRDIQYTVYNIHPWKICSCYFCLNLWLSQLPPSEVFDGSLSGPASGVWGKNCIVGASATFIRGLLRFGGNISRNPMKTALSKHHWNYIGTYTEGISTMTNCMSWSRPCWFAFKKKLCRKKDLRLSLSKLC